MRPAVGASPDPAPARKSSIGGGETSAAGGGGAGRPSSFMLASEAELEQRESASVTDSTYGIRSIDDDTMALEGGEQGLEQSGTLRPHRRSTVIRTTDMTEKEISNTLRMLETIQREESNRSPSRGGHQATDISQPLTPVSFASHAFGSSVPSSPKSLSMRSFQHSDDDLEGHARASFRHSDDELESGSQAVASSEDEVEAMLPSTAMPPQQFIMPSLIMPSRRPFTQRGRRMGKLKVMVAGPSRIGKTSLIKSIIQTCEDIIHVDAASLQSLQTFRRKSRALPPAKAGQVMEIHASTKAHPEWWTEADGSSMLQRRRSIDESVLARNLCFIDTPGYDRGTSMLEGMEPALQYLESQMRRSVTTTEQSDSELLSLLSGHGGQQVDAVLYLMNPDLNPADVEFIRQLNALSNVIPLLAHSDLLPDESLADLKCSAVATLSAAGIPLLPLPSLDSHTPTPPLTVCSCASTDLDAMDASVLMQSEYLQPLRPSDLPHLITLLFHPTNAQALKHAAASKLLTWRTTQQRAPLTTPLHASSFDTQSTLDTNSTTTSLITTRLTPSALRSAPNRSQADDERVAQLRRAAWAASLQRTLTHERRRYERLAQGERVAWLRQQLDEYGAVQLPAAEIGRHGSGSSKEMAPATHGTLAPLYRGNLRRRRASWSGDADLADPLGIVRWRQTGWLVLQVAGGCGVLGAALVWALQRWSGGGGASGAWSGGGSSGGGWSGSGSSGAWSWWPSAEDEGLAGMWERLCERVWVGVS